MTSSCRLSIVTVTYNNIAGLKKTVDSIKAVLAENSEYWIIDNNSSDGTQAFLKAEAQSWIRWISEPDSGLYDAMNKSLTRISGDYALFVNAGDLLLKDFSWPEFSRLAEAEKEKVLVGQTIERYDEDRYLRPSLGKEDSFLEAPPHQATFYPHAFFRQERYRLDMPISADGEYTSRAATAMGAVFVPQPVCEFELGGLSSNYGSFRSIRLRWFEEKNFGGRTKLITKMILWRTLPRPLFYRFLAIGKYTKI